MKQFHLILFFMFSYFVTLAQQWTKEDKQACFEMMLSDAKFMWKDRLSDTKYREIATCATHSVVQNSSPNELNSLADYERQEAFKHVLSDCAGGLSEGTIEDSVMSADAEARRQAANFAQKRESWTKENRQELFNSLYAYLQERYIEKYSSIQMEELADCGVNAILEEGSKQEFDKFQEYEKIKLYKQIVNICDMKFNFSLNAPPKEQLFGTWETERYAIRFRSDGTFEHFIFSTKQKTSGKWWVEYNKLYTSKEDGSQTAINEIIKLYGENFTLKPYNSDKPEILRKAMADAKKWDNSPYGDKKIK